MNASPGSSTTATRLAFSIFWLVQLCCFATASGVIAFRTANPMPATGWPPLRDEPLQLDLGYDDPLVVSDEQLHRVLLKLVPRFVGTAAKINHIDHALRFWGSEAAFPTLPNTLTGEQMRSLVTDHRVFTDAYGDQAEPLLQPAPQGVRVQVQQGATTSSHYDHTTATLAEIGTPLRFPVFPPGQVATFGDLVRQSLADFRLNQREYEWSILTYALLVDTATFNAENHSYWTTGEGQQVDFDRLARRLMRQEMPQGVCFGMHRLYTLAILLRVDEQNGQPPILTPQGRQAIVDYLTEMTARLMQHQHYDGFWNADWPTHAASSSQPTSVEGDRLADRILATGHTLEWWAIAPPEVHPLRGTIRRAGRWLVRTIDQLEPNEVAEYYTFLSHAGRALALWRHRLPTEVVGTSPAESVIGLSWVRYSIFTP